MRWWFAALLLVMTGVILQASAQQYPSRAIRLIVPFEPGGAPDVVARIVAGAVQKPLGQSVIVENRTGANGIIGMQAVAAADPDGYTLLNTPPAFVVNPSVNKALPFDIFRDFAPVANVGISAGYILMVRPGLPVNTVAELIDYAKTHRLLYGSAGVGNTLHLAAALFCAKAGIEMEHVPFRGAAPDHDGAALRHDRYGFRFADCVELRDQWPIARHRLFRKGAVGEFAERSDGQGHAAELRHRRAPGRVGWRRRRRRRISLRSSMRHSYVLKKPAFHEAIVNAGYEPTDMSPAEFSDFLHAEADALRGSGQGGENRAPIARCGTRARSADPFAGPPLPVASLP